MKIIDAHIHTWQLADGKKNWIREKIAALQYDFTMDDFAASVEGYDVEGAIIVQSSSDIAETDRLLAQSAGDPRVLGITGWLDLASEEVAQQADAYLKKPGFSGIRAESPSHFDTGWLLSDPVHRGLGVMAKKKVPVDFLMNCTQLTEFRQIVEPVEGLVSILDHGGRPFVMTGDTSAWKKDIQGIARNTQCYCKLSGLAERAGVEWTADTLEPWVSILLEEFGPERLIFATNWPVMRLMASPKYWIEALDTIFARAGLSHSDQQKIFADNAGQVYLRGVEQ
ncbi:amidohydrolase family protein [Alphaproteobacteria bacterium KMM 3653]|uniref:Amidohydrolase family protein n=1 Tax=Harenicola maris TaxID=2841044 RepID=A0AAP2CR26_9RHOB|nr:amidohydrolase family protein [Harenicola maris]